MHLDVIIPFPSYPLVDLAAEAPTTPASLPSSLPKAESISKPVDEKPKGSNLNLSILKEAYQKKPPQEPARKRSPSPVHSQSSEDSDSSRANNSRRLKTHRRRKKTDSQPTEATPAELEKRRKRFQPVEPPTSTITSELEPTSTTELVGTMMTMEKEYFRLTCVGFKPRFLLDPHTGYDSPEARADEVVGHLENTHE